MQNSYQAQGILWQIPAYLKPCLSLSHPRVFHTPNNLARLMANVSEKGPAWAQKAARKHMSVADSLRWVTMSDEDIRALVPPRNSFFMYGYRNVCPDGSTMTVSWDNPGKVRSGSGLLLPNESHPDDGQGWIDAAGRVQYFVARWHGFVVEEMTKSLEPLAYAYLISGEQRYAHVTAVILDALATIYPLAIEGPLDYPGLKQGYEGGRLERPYYQVARHLILYVNAADLIWNSGELDGKSPTNPCLSMKENIAFNLLLNGGDYCYRQATGPAFSKALNNGAADYNRGALAVGAFLGIAEYIDWVLNGPTSIYNMIANNIDRDGMYFETSANYTDHTRNLYLTVAEILYNLRTATHPEGVNLYNDPHFERFYVGSKEKSAIAGRQPAYGDTSSDTKHYVSDVCDEEAFDQTVRFYVRSYESVKQAELVNQLVKASHGQPDKYLGSVWQLCNLTNDITPTAIPFLECSSQRSEVLGGKGMAYLRSGCQRGVVMRYGPSLNHGQYDELALLIYANGREHSYDCGYGVTPYGLGFQCQTVAHLTAVVNEKSQLTPESAGGSLNFFACTDGFSVVDASDEAAYLGEGVCMYRRCVALVDASPTASYVVDIFRVGGGQVRDYSFHARGSAFTASGLYLSPPMEGSLAGANYSWGKKVRHDSSIIGHESMSWKWIPEPGNGFGFLTEAQRGDGAADWCAEWRAPEAKTRLRMLPAAGREVLVANGPNLMDVKYVLARDRGGKPSQFVTIIEATQDDYPTTGMCALTFDETDMVNASGLAPVAFRVILPDGKYDTVLSTLSRSVFTANDQQSSYATDAEFALVRCGPNGVDSLHMVKGTTLTCGVITVSTMFREYSGTVVSVDYESGSLVLESTQGLAPTLAGSSIHFDAPEYSHNSPYKIAHIKPEGEYHRVLLHPNRLALAKGKLGGEPADGCLHNVTHLPYSRNVVKKGPSSYYDGKLVVGAHGAQAQIKSVQTDYAALKVDNSLGFTADEDIVIYDIKAGDTFSIPVTVHLAKHNDNSYLLSTPVPVSVKYRSTGEEHTVKCEAGVGVSIKLA